MSCPFCGNQLLMVLAASRLLFGFGDNSNSQYGHTLSALLIKARQFGQIGLGSTL